MYAGTPNTARVPANSLNNGFTASLKDAVPNAVSDAASSVQSKVKSDVNAAKSATSDLRNTNVDASLLGKANKGEVGKAASDPKNKVPLHYFLVSRTSMHHLTLRARLTLLSMHTGSIRCERCRKGSRQGHAQQPAERSCSDQGCCHP